MIVLSYRNTNEENQEKPNYLCRTITVLHLIVAKNLSTMKELIQRFTDTIFVKITRVLFGKLFKDTFIYIQHPRNGDTIMKQDSKSPGTTTDRNASPLSVVFIEALHTLKPHDHLCLIYETEEEWYSAAISFIAGGLQRNEKCVYVVDTHTADQICIFLRGKEVDVDAALNSGQLAILHETEAYTKDGVFDPDKMIALLIEETEKALSEGYSALRVTGEMSWALRGHPGSEALLEYEAKLNRDFFPYYPCVAICQYHRGMFDPAILRYVVMTHPLIVRNNMLYHNPYYIPPEEFLSQKRNHYDLERWLESLEYHVLVAETIRHSEKLEALNAISATISQSLELKEVLDDALKKTLEVLNVEGGIVYVLDECTEILTPTASYGFSRAALEKVIQFKTNEGLPGYAAQRGNPVSISDLAGTTLRISPVYAAEGYQSLVSVPLQAEGTLKGVLIIGSRVKARFRPGDVNLLASIGNQIGVAIENAQLYEASQRELKERMRIDEALRESERKYRELVENISDVIYLCDTEGMVTYISPVVETITGYQPSEIINRSFIELVYEEDRERSIEAFQNIISGSTHRAEYRIVTKSGQIRWISGSARPICENNCITGVQGVITDIANRKLAEEAIRKSEEKYRTFVRNLRGIAFRGGMDWIPLFFDGAVKEITGYTEDEFLSGEPTWREIIHPDDWSRIAESAEAIAANPNYSTDREYRIIRKDSEIRWVQEFIQNLCDNSGTPAVVQGMIYDITDRKKAEEEVMQLSTAVKMSNDSTVITDLEGTIIYVNDATLKLYRTQKREDLIGKNLLDIIIPEDRKKVSAKIEEVSQKGSVRNWEYDLMAKDGTRITVETSMVTMKTAGGTPRGFVGVTRDITERKKAEKEMKRKLMRYDLEEGNIYLVKESVLCTSVEAFEDLLTVGYPGLAFSRTPRSEFKDKFRQEFDYLWIAERGKKSYIPPELDKIQGKIEMLERATALFIDRLDYLMSKASFAETLSFVQILREIAYLKGHVIILSLDPSTLAPQELSQIEKETLTVEPLYKTKLPEELIDILKVVYEQSTRGINPSYTKVGKIMGLSKPTTRKRVRILTNYGYLEESKKGRTKTLDLTEKGRIFFLK